MVSQEMKASILSLFDLILLSTLIYKLKGLCLKKNYFGEYFH